MGLVLDWSIRSQALVASKTAKITSVSEHKAQLGNGKEAATKIKRKDNALSQAKPKRKDGGVPSLGGSKEESIGVDHTGCRESAGMAYF